MPKKWRNKINVDPSNKITIKPKTELPLTIWLSDTSDVLVRQKFLRTIPNKRWVMTATWGEQDVVAKIFTTAKHAQRELQGYEALKTAGVCTPDLLYHGWAVKQPYYVLIFEHVNQAQDVDQVWWSGSKEQRNKILQELLLLTAKMHQKGIKQNDLHLKNFLLSENNIYVVDTSDVTTTDNNQCLSKRDCIKNLAALFAQIAPSYDENCTDWYLIYIKARNLVFTTRDVTRLKNWIIYRRRQHLNTYARKIFRTTSKLICYKSWRKFMVYDRCYALPELEDLLQNPEAFISEEKNSHVQMLKKGNTCTVARVKIANYDLVIKRYNIKGFWHGIKRAFRSSRAAICWRNAMGLATWRLSVSKPVALIENRFGPLRSTAYFITEYISGTNLQDFCKDEPDNKAALQKVADRVAQLFAELSAIKMTHGDLKANNILLDNGMPILVDLDAMRMHRCAWQWRRAKLKDEQRFAKNWQDKPEIAKVFVGLLSDPRTTSLIS